MHKQLTVWQLIAQSLQQDTAVMLLYVLESNGSSPGRQGFAMCVNANGQMQGSIGGGIMEHKLVTMAKEAISIEREADNLQPIGSLVKKQIHDKSAAKNQSGMICSGDQTILLYRITSHEEATIGCIVTCLQNNKNGLLRLSPGKLFFDSLTTPEKDYYFNNVQEDNWLYEEKLGYKNRLYIIGGGHCALALCMLMATMDFYIILYEERDGLNTMESNGAAHEKHIVESYENLTGLVPAGSNHYVAVMTFGYRTDRMVIKTLMNIQYKYFGLLGSVKKIEKLFTDLKNEGINAQWLRHVHSPIGVQVHSQTPEEIAVSIAAEIIAVKNTTASK